MISITDPGQKLTLDVIMYKQGFPEVLLCQLSRYFGSRDIENRLVKAELFLVLVLQ